MGFRVSVFGVEGFRDSNTFEAKTASHFSVAGSPAGGSAATEPREEPGFLSSRLRGVRIRNIM